MRHLQALFVTGGDVRDLGPYVPSVNDRGTVALTANHADGQSSLWTVDDTGPRCVATTRAEVMGVARFTSHPDIDAVGTLSVYAELRGGQTALVRADDRGVEVLVAAGDHFRAVAPMGPTMNRQGAIAFRASGTDGTEGMYLWTPAAVSTLADSRAFTELDGLPVVNAAGEAVVRVTERDGSAAVLRVRGSERTRVFGSGDVYSQLGRFPTIADDGAVGVAAERRDRGWTYLVARGGACREVFPPGSVAFVRGGLLASGGMLAAYVTPHGGSPGVVVGPDPADLLFTIGAQFLGATITDYALNPVSGADSGWIAVRLVLSDGRQIVARSREPIRPW